MVSRQGLPNAKGLVRIRSNISHIRDLSLVPGDEMRRHNMHFENLTQKQQDELLYYEPCSLCKRLIFEIYDQGCDRTVCQSNGVVSTAEAEKRRIQYSDS